MLKLRNWSQVVKDRKVLNGVVQKKKSSCKFVVEEEEEEEEKDKEKEKEKEEEKKMVMRKRGKRRGEE